MRSLFVLCSLCLYSLPLYAGTGVPNYFDAYAGSYKGFGSQSGAKEPNCSVQIAQQSVNGRKTILFSLVDGNRPTTFLADAEELTEKIRIGKNESLILTLGTEELNLNPANPSCQVSSFAYIGVWTRNLEFTNGLKIADGDLNYVMVKRSLDCGTYTAIGESFVCGRLNKTPPPTPSAFTPREMRSQVGYDKQ
ncbi:MAG: hypothetical protein ACXWQO_02400 [Bdellovibrionota bacterium]